MSKICQKLHSFRHNMLSIVLIAVILSSMVAVSGCNIPNTVEDSESTSALATDALTDNNDIEKSEVPKITNTPDTTITTTNTPVVTTGRLKVHYIDVGQGDSILIEQGDMTMLIDAGEKNKGTVVTRYLDSLNIDDIDYLIGTHPHSDHIGGMATVINSISVKNAIIPNKEHDTKTYEAFIDALIDKNVNTIPAAPGETYSLGEAKFTVLGPVKSNYKDLNDWSVVIKLTYGNKSFMFTGDAEKLAESDIISKGYDLSADVLKIGHHGSTTSTSTAFLNKVSPTYAVISCAVENSYGHPHDETIDLLNSKNITLYGTYKNGTVIAICDGNTITFETEK